jgi:hypothetical protein
MPRRAFLFALFFAAAPAAAQNIQSLDGWGAFRFGMSPDQARAVPGTEFGRYSRKDILQRDNGAMASKKPALMNGVAYNFNLYFNAFDRLYEVGLWHETTTSQADCESRFLALLDALERSYGKFAPLYPQKVRNDQDQLPMTITWKNGLGGSRYQQATVYMSAETAYVWEARKSFDSHYVDAAAVWSAESESANAVCLTEIDVRA